MPPGWRANPEFRAERAFESGAHGNWVGIDARGRVAITQVTLRPAVRFAGRQPSAAELAALHHEAHEQCFIANSVRCEVRWEPVLAG